MTKSIHFYVSWRVSSKFLNELDYDEVYIHAREPHENRVSDETEVAITKTTRKEKQMAKIKRIEKIALENVRQYFVPNEKEGQLFIIEGKAVNRFPEARELIRIKASLFGKQGAEVATQEFMCGNVVSLYQLQVSSKADIEAALTAKVGILTNNTNIQPGASVPFMAVFFHTPETVEEFGLEVIQSTLPQQ